MNWQKSVLFWSIWSISLPGLAAWTSPYEACFMGASQRHGVNHNILKAIAYTESTMNPRAVNRNTNGTYDMGIMQINSQWLTTLQRYRIREEQLWRACENIYIGAWILSMNVRQYGYNWEAVGAYNVGCRKLSRQECRARRSRYESRVYHNYQRVMSSH